MQSILDRLKCTGCSACYAECPKHAISMIANHEGFLEPSIDEKLCVHCNRCARVCPVSSSREERNLLGCYAAQFKDRDVRMHSSSGGVFSALAFRTLSKGGSVYGAVFDTRDRKVRHVRVVDKREIPILRGSKYVQSEMGGVFLSVRRDLCEGKEVLFVGTPCQVGGLKSYLKGVDDRRLLTVDLLCYGVPSPLVLQKYISELDRVSGKRVYDIKFRDKFGNLSWRKYTVRIVFDDKTEWQLQDGDRLRSYDSIMMSAMAFRRSCYNCAFRNGASTSDITIGDGWGVPEIVESMADDSGISLVLVHNHKGLDALSACDVDIRSVPYDFIIKNNPYYKRSARSPEGRDYFYQHISNTSCMYSLIVRCLRGGTIWGIVKHYLKKVNRKI